MQPLKAALTRVHEVAKKKKSHILHTSEISRADRTLLSRLHWLEEVTKGWYLLVRPDIPAGDSTAWYANFWDFIQNYLEFQYGEDYCLSAECSLDLHLGNTVIPNQVIVMAKKGGGTPLQLPFNTSLLAYKSALPEEKIKIRGVQVMTLPYALCKVSPTYFQKAQEEVEIALCSLSSASSLLQVIAEHQFHSGAERIVGAYRHLGNNERADEIKSALLDIGMVISEKNPFLHEASKFTYFQSPHIGRIHTLWKRWRPLIIDHFPKPRGLPKESTKYLAAIEEKYAQDAYNSLSIEGYQVSKELIEKVMQEKWAPDFDSEDQMHKNALAARGYYEAHRLVKLSVEKVLNGESAGVVAQNDLPKWYQKLFSPSVQAGIVGPGDLFGYRKHQVYIRGSRHTPPEKEYLGDLMETLFQKLQEEPHAGVRAILGHFIFVYIHPYMDGNGRLGRFLMNLMFASGGYPWTIIHVANRSRYIQALEAASSEGDILPFTRFIEQELTR